MWDAFLKWSFISVSGYSLPWLLFLTYLLIHCVSASVSGHLLKCMQHNGVVTNKIMQSYDWWNAILFLLKAFLFVNLNKIKLMHVCYGYNKDDLTYPQPIHCLLSWNYTMSTSFCYCWYLPVEGFCQWNILPRICSYQVNFPEWIYSFDS